MRRRVLGLVLLVGIAWWGAARPAAAENMNDYVMFTPGIYQPESDVFGSRNGYQLEGLYGHFFYDKYTHNLGAEVALGMSDLSGSSTKGGLTIDTKVRTFSLAGYLRYAKQFGSSEVYVAAGGGVYMPKVEMTVSGAVSGSTSFQDYRFGLNAKAGYMYVFPSGFSLGGEVKYMDYKVPVDGVVDGDLSMSGFVGSLVLGYSY